MLMVLIIDQSHACYLVGIDNDEHSDGTIPKKLFSTDRIGSQVKYAVLAENIRSLGVKYTICEITRSSNFQARTVYFPARVLSQDRTFYQDRIYYRIIELKLTYLK